MAPEPSLRVGATLPHFGADAEDVIRFALQAERAGLDGVFAFDHLWPPGEPGQGALACIPTLAAVAASTKELVVGSLVARVTLLPPETLVDSATVLHVASGGRMIAGVGLGDKTSEPEERAFGLDRLGVAERLGRLESVLDGLRARGIPSWVGIGAPKRPPGARLRTALDIAERSAATVCSWRAPSLVDLRSVLGPSLPLAWSGPCPDPDHALGPLLDEARQARLSWIVVGWPKDVEELGRALRTWREHPITSGTEQPRFEAAGGGD